MLLWISAILVLAVTCVGSGVVYKRWRRKRIAQRRIVEKPNSFYSSALVKHQEDREAWGKVDLDGLHPLNREEVERLLTVVDVQGPGALSSRERLFLENMTRVSVG
jgi:hypothetical protein